jgi:hypothetical protein
MAMEAAVVAGERELLELGDGVVALGDALRPGRLELVLAQEAQRPQVVDDVMEGRVGQDGVRLLVRGVDDEADEPPEGGVDHRARLQVAASSELVVDRADGNGALRDGALRDGSAVAVPGVLRHGRYAYYRTFPVEFTACGQARAPARRRGGDGQPQVRRSASQA